MIGIPQDNLCFDDILQLVLGDGLNGTHCPDGHEDGSLDLAVIGLKDTCSG